MKHSDFSIRNVLDRLMEKSMKDSTPKKYAGVMFEAAEVIRQLMAEVKAVRNFDGSQIDETITKLGSMASDRTLHCKYRALAGNAQKVMAQLRYQLAVANAQIPVVPHKDSLADRSCPNCDAYINWDALNDSGKDLPKFCSNCGAEFDWSKEPKYVLEVDGVV